MYMKKTLFLLLISTAIMFSFSCNSKSKNQGSKVEAQISEDAIKALQQSQETEEAEDIFEKEFLFDSTKAVKDKGKVSFGKISGTELTRAMTIGWNLGNTFDATGANGMNSETSWGQPYTKKEMIDGLAASGIKTLRIPITWHNHIIDTETYTIDPAWMARVKKIVDYAIENDMYVIINAHHDNFSTPAKMPRAIGYYPSSDNLAESQRFLYNVWGQVALAFNNGYDEHLIFETMNEPRPAGSSSEWWYNGSPRSLDAAKCLNQMNQTALDAIRSSGGNNAQRFVMCPALQASENAASNSPFVMPSDTAEGKLILSIHAYTPYSFAMESPGERSFTQAHKDELTTLFANLKKNFIDKGYPVVIGEYGATNKDNMEDRLAWFDFYISSARKLDIPCILWDNGVWQLRQKSDGTADYSEGYGYYNRNEQSWYFPEILDTMLKALAD